LELKAGKLFFADPYNIKLHDQPLNILDKYDVDYEFSENEFVLTIETTGQLTNQEVITKALEALKNKTSEFSKEFAKLFNETFRLLSESNLGTLKEIYDDEDEKFDLIITNPPYITSGVSSIKDEIKSEGIQDHYTKGGKALRV